MSEQNEPLRYSAPSAPVLVGSVSSTELTYTFGYAIDAGFYSSQPVS